LATPAESPCFFISYAHDDSRYATRLADRLRWRDLPVWLDTNLPWGGIFPREITDRLRYALAIIVLMSPAAAASSWMEREILEGQRFDRQFLPILLAGERLFLLASSNYFDARGGAFPGEREFAQLVAIRDKDPSGTSETPPIVLPRPARRPAATVPLPGEVSVDRLRELLAAGEVPHADIVSTALLLRAAGRLEEGWLRQEDARAISFNLLDQVDAAWAELSGARQGLRAQVTRLRGTAALEFSAVAVALGWKRSRAQLTERYGAFLANAGVTAEPTALPDWPPGFFPTLRNPQLERHGSWHDQWRVTVLAAQGRFREWSRS
jgi:hypothetical protein